MRMDLEEIDSIIGAGNIHYTGKELRKDLEKAGYYIVSNGKTSGFSCTVCGSEFPKIEKY